VGVVYGAVKAKKKLVGSTVGGENSRDVVQPVGDMLGIKCL
jgi:hypothetical protein